jgi:hypothetical protein
VLPVSILGPRTGCGGSGRQGDEVVEGKKNPLKRKPRVGSNPHRPHQQIADLQNRHASAIMANYVSHYESGAGTPFNAYALLGVLQSVDDLAACFMWIDPSDVN